MRNKKPMTAQSLILHPQKAAEAVTKSQLIQASALILGIAFTYSAVVNHYYNIELNKIRIKREAQMAADGKKDKKFQAKYILAGLGAAGLVWYSIAKNKNAPAIAAFSAVAIGAGWWVYDNRKIFMADIKS